MGGEVGTGGIGGSSPEKASVARAGVGAASKCSSTENMTSHHSVT